MLTRREYLAATAKIGAALALPQALFAQAGEVMTRPIPKTGERVPIVGLGSSATFSQVAGAADTEAIKSVFTAMLEQGGTVFDTAPGYGASEEVAAKAVNDLGVRDRVFWATKLNVAGRGASADPARARAQVDTSLARLGRDKIDLIQVHNVADMATQFPILEEYKQAGRVRYIGTTTTFKPQYETLLSSSCATSRSISSASTTPSTISTPSRASSRSRRSAASACSSICRSAARAYGSASKGTRCRRGPPSSARRRGRSSS